MTILGLHFHFLVSGVVLAIGLPSVIATLAYAQAEGQELSGTYVNQELGLEITFPDGWSGSISESASQLEGFVVPGGEFIGTEPAKAITLVAYHKPFDAKRDPFDPAKATQGRSDCDIPYSLEHRTVYGVDAVDTMVICTETGSTLRTIGVETKDKWFAITYYSPTPEFGTDIGKFEATVDSLKIQDAVNATFGVGGFLKITHSEFVTVGGEPVEIKFATSSDIFDLELDEETKTLTFGYIGGNISVGEFIDTEVLVGKVLKGPYVVTVDGIEATSQGSLYYPGIKYRFFATSIAYPGIETVVVEQLPGEHRVMIVGTQVVPEFPTAALGVIAVLIGIVALIGRTNFGLVNKR